MLWRPVQAGIAQAKGSDVVASTNHGGLHDTGGTTERWELVETLCLPLHTQSSELSSLCRADNTQAESYGGYTWVAGQF